MGLQYALFGKDFQADTRYLLENIIFLEPHAEIHRSG